MPRAMLQSLEGTPSFFPQLEWTSILISEVQCGTDSMVLECGASLVLLQDRNGYTALHIAAQRGLNNVCLAMIEQALPFCT
jgi:hypothetical protein